MIRTPDQRLRVFVSSTLVELGPERTAVKAAIERLALIPVLFESGARPHAPQEVYRAYLQQSDIFVGIYAASYGWVVPGMDISGLEDEFRLSGKLPRLIYVKRIGVAKVVVGAMPVSLLRPPHRPLGAARVHSHGPLRDTCTRRSPSSLNRPPLNPIQYRPRLSCIMSCSPKLLLRSGRSVRSNRVKAPCA